MYRFLQIILFLSLIIGCTEDKNSSKEKQIKEETLKVKTIDGKDYEIKRNKEKLIFKTPVMTLIHIFAPNIINQQSTVLKRVSKDFPKTIVISIAMDINKTIQNINLQNQLYTEKEIKKIFPTVDKKNLPMTLIYNEDGTLKKGYKGLLPYEMLSYEIESIKGDK